MNQWTARLIFALMAISIFVLGASNDRWPAVASGAPDLSLGAGAYRFTVSGGCIQHNTADGMLVWDENCNNTLEAGDFRFSNILAPPTGEVMTAQALVFVDANGQARDSECFVDENDLWNIACSPSLTDGQGMILFEAANNGSDSTGFVAADNLIAGTVPWVSNSRGQYASADLLHSRLTCVDLAAADYDTTNMFPKWWLDRDVSASEAALVYKCRCTSSTSPAWGTSCSATMTVHACDPTETNQTTACVTGKWTSSSFSCDEDVTDSVLIDVGFNDSLIDKDVLSLTFSDFTNVDRLLICINL